MPKILVVDDIEALADQYAYDLQRVGDFDARVAIGGREAIEQILSTAVDCVILDLEMPDVDGFAVLRALKEHEVETPVIVYTGTGDYARCVQAVKLGAYSFIDKAEPMEQVVHEVRRALDHASMSRELSTLRARTESESRLAGSSAPMQKLKDQIARIAPVPSAVLIEGESGTGKEVVAREIHRLFADGADRPFVAINCAALPENLVESELFGHERGAFTGAAKLHRGAFERAAGGTLFLDEIGEMPAAAQAKLLRVLETKEMTRVGGEKPVKVRARVVAATNRNLADEVEAGSFRQDLLFRLNIHSVSVPPLRDRRSDIPELAEQFVETISRDFGMRRKRLSPAAVEALTAYEWRSNNVRELRNAIERAIIASDTQLVGLEHLPDEIADLASTQAANDGSFAARKKEAERQIVITALQRNAWHVTNTAAELGLADHASLLKIMRRLGVDRPA